MGKGINPNLKLRSKTLRSIDEYVNGINNGDRFVLSEVLTLVESTNSDKRTVGEKILNLVGNQSRKNSIRVGITGSPGAGKSTFIEALGTMLTSLGKKVAVLAVDPSSTRSQGSILGDKTRMSRLSINELAFVRPTASANRLGGVAQATKESIALCEAAGYEIILVESVGVGQSETELEQLVDLYLLLLLPGGGDGVQGIKRGVMELADLLVINKYDGDRKIIAEQSKKDFSLAVRLFHHDLEGWQVPVKLCSAIKNEFIGEVWSSVERFIELSRSKGYFLENRNVQDQAWVDSQISNEITHRAEMLFDIEDDIKNIATHSSNSVFQIFNDTRNKIETDFQNLMNKKK